MSALPSLLGAVGGVAFAFGLLSALLALFQPLVPAGWIVGNLAFGAAALVASAALGFDALRDGLRSGASRRRALHGANAIAGAALSLAIVAMLAFLSTRYTLRFDWSEQRVNTLSPQTLALLDRLDRDVTLLAFFRERDSIEIRDLLDRYAHASDRVDVRFVDPDVRPDLVEAHALGEQELARGVILATIADDATATGAAARIPRASELDVTNTLATLLFDRRRKIYFLTGHNERRIEKPADAAADAASADESAAGPGGFARAAEALARQGFDVAPLLLAAATGVPDDADALIVAGPTRPFLDGELDAIDRYLAGGGAVAVLIDPRAQTNAYDRLRAWGADVGDDVVVDPVLSLQRQPTAPLAAAWAEDHPIAHALGPAVFPMARSVTADASGGLAPIAFTSGTAWAERDLDAWIRTGRAVQDDADLVGPVPLAVAGRPRGGDGRLVVVGDSSFATNEFFGAFSNGDLLLNAVRWLAGESEQIAVRPHVARASSVALTAGEFQAIQYLSLFVLPEGVATVGALVWWSRRRRDASG